MCGLNPFCSTKWKSLPYAKSPWTSAGEQFEFSLLHDVEISITFMLTLKKVYNRCRCMGYSVQISPICATASDVWQCKSLKSGLWVKSPICANLYKNYKCKYPICEIPIKIYNRCRCVTVQMSQICTMCKMPIKIYNCCRCVDWSPSAALCADLYKNYVQISNLWNLPKRCSTAADVWIVRLLLHYVQISNLWNLAERCSTAADVWLCKCLKSGLCVKSPIKIYNCCRCVEWTASAALCANLYKNYVQFFNLWNPPERCSTAADVWLCKCLKSALCVKSTIKIYNCCRCVDWTASAALCANLQFVKSARKMFNCCRCVTVRMSQICTMCKIPIKIYNWCRCVDWSPSAALCANLQKDVQLLQMCGGWIPSYYGKVCKACHWQRNIAFWAVPPPPPPPPSHICTRSTHPQALAHTGLVFHNILWGARNRVGIGLSYRPARKHWQLGQFDNSVRTRFLAPIECSRIPTLDILTSVFSWVSSIQCWILEQSMGFRNWVGIGVSYRPARLS